MILLGLGAEMLARLMNADPRGPDSAWLLAGPTELAVELDQGEEPDLLTLAAE
jgi:hypothetical protein